MEAKVDKITEDKINKACFDGFIDYLVANMQSIWIDGKKVQIKDISKYPERGQTYPDVNAIYEIGDVIQELMNNEIVTLNFNAGCCLFKITGIDMKDCESVEVISRQSKGSLFKLEDNTLKFEIERIDFKTKYKNY